MKKIILCILISIVTVSVYSQDSFFTAKVKGLVVDSISGESMTCPTISVLAFSNKKVVKRLAAETDGKFNFELNKKGEYLIVISYTGYKTIEKKLVVNEKDYEYNLGTMQIRESITDIDKVEVIAHKQLIKVEADKIVYNTEADPDVNTSTALEMLRRVPLVTVDGEDNIQLKGNSNFKIHMNGKPSTMMTKNAKDLLKSLPASSIKNIEVITSPGAKYDAEGVGGIINIVTYKKRLKGYTGSLNTGVNTFGNINGGINFSASLGKFVFSVNTSYYNRRDQKNRNTVDRINYNDNNLYLMNSKGEGLSGGSNIWGSGDFSYEIDTLNLISGNFSYWKGTFSRDFENVTNIFDINDNLSQSYITNNDNRFSYGNPGGNIDYQRTSKHNKEQISTLSYKLNYSVDDHKNDQQIDSILEFYNNKKIINQHEKSIEHTFQADHVQPILKIGKLEVGAKYIIRLNTSKSDGTVYDFETLQYNDNSEDYLDFSHTQNIMAGYTSFKGNIKKFSYKAGLRVEYSETDGVFNSENNTDFKKSETEYVPSCSFSYNINKKNSLQVSYSKRIQRPSIWYLNPYKDDSNPKSIRFGNPNLNSEHFHTFDLNYNLFMKIGNINFSSFYSFSNNGIDRVSWIENEDIINTTYKNIIQKEQYGLSTQISLRFGKKISLNGKIAVNYNDITNNTDDSQNNSGWGSSSYLRLQYKITKSFKVSAYGGLYKGGVGLQSSGYTYDYSGLTLTKEFFDGKLSFSVSARNLDKKERKFKSNIEDVNFKQENYYYRPGRNFRFNIRFRFGEMKTRVKKAQRGIHNTDVKEGDSDNSQK